MILAQWLRDKPEGKVEVVEAGTRPALWQELRVRGTPSILLEDPKTGRSLLIEGLANSVRLENALTALRGSQAPGEGQKKGSKQ